MSECFPKPRSLGANVKVELHLSNYATKAKLKNATRVNTTKFNKFDLAGLKSGADKLDINKWKIVPSNLKNFKNKEDKLDIDKLVPAPVDLSKLSDVVKNDVIKKKMYIMLRSKVLNIKYLVLLTYLLILLLMLK